MKFTLDYETFIKKIIIKKKKNSTKTEKNDGDWTSELENLFGNFSCPCFKLFL